MIKTDDNFTASEINKLAKQQYVVYTETLLESVKQLILAAANAGEYSVEVLDKQITKGSVERQNTILDYLRDRGFCCEIFSSLGCSVEWEISWRRCENIRIN